MHGVPGVVGGAPRRMHACMGGSEACCAWLWCAAEEGRRQRTHVRHPHFHTHNTHIPPTCVRATLPHTQHHHSTPECTRVGIVGVTVCGEGHEGVVLGRPKVKCGTGVVAELRGLDISGQVEVHLAGGGGGGGEWRVEQKGSPRSLEKGVRLKYIQMAGGDEVMQDKHVPCLPRYLPPPPTNTHLVFSNGIRPPLTDTHLVLSSRVGDVDGVAGYCGLQCRPHSAEGEGRGGGGDVKVTD